MDTSVLVSAALVAAVLGVAIGALWARHRAAARELALTAENAKLAAQLETERAAAADNLTLRTELLSLFERARTLKTVSPFGTMPTTDAISDRPPTEN